MRRALSHSQIDSDGLQADVMRFMAIIAFCLIAILALVKDLEGQDPEQKMLAEVATEKVRPVEREIPSPTKVEPESVKQVVVKPVEVPPVVKPAKREAPVKEIVEDNPIVEQPQPEVAEKQEPPAEQKPLSLRFASDAVFIDLIAGGKIQVFQKSEQGVHSLNSRFKVEDTRPDGPVYELRAGSVPRKIKRMFSAATGEPVYLVSLPYATRQQIDRLITEAKGGVLIVDRNGEVRYEP